MSFGSDKKVVGNRLKVVRGHLSQNQFAHMTGSCRNSVDRYEKGVASPTMEFMASVCTRFDINPTWLLTGEGPMKKGSLSGGLTPEYTYGKDEFLNHLDKRLTELEIDEPDFRTWFRVEFKKKFPEIINGKKTEVEDDKVQIRIDKDIWLKLLSKESQTQQIAIMQKFLTAIAVKNGLLKDRRKKQVTIAFPDRRSSDNHQENGNNNNNKE